MNMLKKIVALMIALAMVLVMSTAALADTTELEENDEEGVAGDWITKDTVRVMDKSVNIKKEIVAFNPNSTKVHAPVVTYTYTVTPADVSQKSVTDEEGVAGDTGAGDHKSGDAVTAPVNAGILKGLVVTGATVSGSTVTAVDGTAGTSESTSVTATLVFDNSSTWTTAAAGYTNEYNIKLDFSGVTFPSPGVYRYEIVETIADGTANEDNYDLVAMKDGAFDTVYLDVYVDGSLNIYGYVCMKENTSVTPNTDTKINGFVEGTNYDGSDKYYTYDLVLSKNVLNDAYAVTNTALP